MSIHSGNGFYLPNGDFIEFAGRTDLYLDSVQDVLAEHLVTLKKDKRLICGCSSSEKMRYLIPFHEPGGKIGIRRERIDDGHPVTCMAHLDLEKRSELSVEDFAIGNIGPVKRSLAITRFSWLALRAAASAYARVWSESAAYDGHPKVKPGHFFNSFSKQLGETVLPGPVLLDDFLEGAGLHFCNGLLEALPCDLGREDSEKLMVPAVVWLGNGFHRQPMAVEKWLIESLRRSVSIFGQPIPGPYLFSAIWKNGLVINMWIKPVYLGVGNLAIMDSDCERQHAAVLDFQKLEWFKPPTKVVLLALPVERKFWGFSKCLHRPDFAVFVRPNEIRIDETSTFDPTEHPEYHLLADRRVNYFNALPTINKYRVKASKVVPGGVARGIPFSDAIKQSKEMPDLNLVTNFMLALLQK